MPSRQIFGYESNASEISKILVPDPLSRIVWETSAKDWERGKTDNSLLEWLVLSGAMDEDCLLSHLSMATGARILPPHLAQPDHNPSAESQLLRNLGFLPLVSIGKHKLVAGGTNLYPDLKIFLGTDASDWEWVLISPLRSRPDCNPRQLQIRPGEDAPLQDARLKELLTSFLSRGVADIHFERVEDELRIRVHESGRMHDIDQWRGQPAESALRLLKTWSGFSTAAESLPQDGRISFKARSGRIHFRSSLVATINGESLVLRNHGAQHERANMLELGIPSPLRQSLLDHTLNSSGLIIVSGPTGSGKTTTLYALLQALRDQNLKILSIEDPVESDLSHVVQSDVNPVHCWSFDSAIRAFLRQDPDIIFVGEMRDRESAHAACRAALTGHCVLATLHAKSIESVNNRLTGWGVPAGTIKDTMRMIVNQRLVADNQAGTQKAVFEWWDANGRSTDQAV